METVPLPRLKALIGPTPRTEALIDGRVVSPLLTLDIDSGLPVTNGFPAMVRDMPYDFGELALLTFLQARAAGRPLVLLPFVMAAEFLHQHLHFNSEFGVLKPEDLAGRRIGVRSYTQTSGLWIRGFLEEDYGIDFAGQQWVTFQDPHVTSYQEPAFVERAPEDATLVQMLLDGKIDAAVGIGAAAQEHPQLRCVFPEGAGEEWSRKRGLFPINHMAVVKSELHAARPDISRDLFRMLSESKNLAPIVPGGDMRPSGVEANRRGMELLAEWAVRQQLLPERVAIDDLFDDTTRNLGA